MKKIAFVLLIFILCGLTFCQKKSAKTEKAQVAEKTRQEFLHAWNGYKQYAWGHDDLKPLSGGYQDWYNEPLLMTAVDALDALILLGFKAEADATREYIAQNLSFDRDISVKVFEINIRLLGGLISSYQLIKDIRLLNLARDLADRLSPAFDSPTGMPYTFINLKTGVKSGADTNPAEIGTLILEFGALSKITGNSSYYNKAKRAITEIYNRRSKLGLVPSSINVETGQWLSEVAHIGGCIDSYYEYLYKAWLLFGDVDFKTMWETHVAAIHKYLAVETESGLWYGRANMNTGKIVENYFGNLDAFFAGLLALSGDLSRAERLQHSAMKMWNAHNLEPEMFDFSKMQIVDWGAYYNLRPEIIESAFYLYRFTKNPEFLEMGTKIFSDIERNCRTEIGYAQIKDVRTKDKVDYMDSYFLAETLKYAYLLFAPESILNLEDYVFTTEAHPICKKFN